MSFDDTRSRLPLYYEVLGFSRHEPARDLYMFLKANFENFRALRRSYEARRGRLFIAELEKQIIFKKNQLEKELDELKKISNESALGEIARLEKQMKLIEKKRSDIPEINLLGARKKKGADEIDIETESKGVESLHAAVEKLAGEISEAQVVLLYLVKKAFANMEQSLSAIPKQLSSIAEKYKRIVQEAYLVLSNPVAHQIYITSASHDSFVANNQEMLTKLLSEAESLREFANVPVKALERPLPCSQVEVFLAGTAQSRALDICWVTVPQAHGMATQYEVQIDTRAETGYRRLRLLAGLSSRCHVPANLLKVDPNSSTVIAVCVRGLNIKGPSKWSPNFYIGCGPLADQSAHKTDLDLYVETCEIEVQQKRLLSYYKQNLEPVSKFDSANDIPLLLGWLNASVRARGVFYYPEEFGLVDGALWRLMDHRMKTDNLQQWKERLNAAMKRTISKNPAFFPASPTIFDDAQLIDVPFSLATKPEAVPELLEDLVQSIDQSDEWEGLGEQIKKLLHHWLQKTRNDCPMLVIETSDDFNGELIQRDGSWIVCGNGYDERLGSTFPIWRNQTPHDRVRAAIGRCLLSPTLLSGFVADFQAVLQKMEAECIQAELNYMHRLNIQRQEQLRSRQSTLKQDEMLTPANTVPVSPQISKSSVSHAATPEGSRTGTPEIKDSPSSVQSVQPKSKKKKKKKKKAKDSEVVVSIPFSLGNLGEDVQASLLEEFAQLGLERALKESTEIASGAHDGLSETAVKKQKQGKTAIEKKKATQVDASATEAPNHHGNSKPSMPVPAVDSSEEKDEDGVNDTNDDLLRLLSIQSGQPLQQLKASAAPQTHGDKIEQSEALDHTDDTASMSSVSSADAVASLVGDSAPKAAVKPQPAQIAKRPKGNFASAAAPAAHNDKTKVTKSGGRTDEKRSFTRDSDEFVTIPCKYFRKGTCHRGNNCPFSHDWSSTEALYHWEAGPNCYRVKRDNTCAQGNTCPFASQHRLVKMDPVDADSLEAKPPKAKTTAAANQWNARSAQPSSEAAKEVSPVDNVGKKAQPKGSETIPRAVSESVPVARSIAEQPPHVTAEKSTKVVSAPVPEKPAVSPNLRNETHVPSVPPGLGISSAQKSGDEGASNLGSAAAGSGWRTLRPNKEEREKHSSVASTGASSSCGVAEGDRQEQQFQMYGLGGASFFEDILGNLQANSNFLQPQPPSLAMRSKSSSGHSPAVSTSIPPGIWGFPSFPSLPLGATAGVASAPESGLYSSNSTHNLPGSLSDLGAAGGLDRRVPEPVGLSAKGTLVSSLDSLGGATLPSDLQESLGLSGIMGPATGTIAVQQPVPLRSSDKLTAVFQQLGLEKYASSFHEQEIDFEALILMKDDDLKEIGIPMGPRRKLGHWIQSMNC